MRIANFCAAFSYKPLKSDTSYATFVLEPTYFTGAQCRRAQPIRTAQHSHKAMPSHLSVLKGAHGAGIDVQIRIDLDAGDPQATTLQHPTDAGDGNALPEAGNDASRYDYVLHGCALERERRGRPRENMKSNKMSGGIQHGGQKSHRAGRPCMARLTMGRPTEETPGFLG